MYSALFVVAMTMVATVQCISDRANVHAANGQVNALNAMCFHYCIKTVGPCPKECLEAHLGSWSFAKRSPGLEGLTFDDYLFMRLMGRDMAGRRRR